MCLFPTIVRNKRYTITAKNGGAIPTVNDTRVLHTSAGCGKCIECRRQYANNWKIRLSEHIKEESNGKMITLTFSNENLLQVHKKLIEKINKKINTSNKEKEKRNLQSELLGYKRDNNIATLAVRLFLERVRKHIIVTGKQIGRAHV